MQQGYTASVTRYCSQHCEVHPRSAKEALDWATVCSGQMLEKYGSLKGVEVFVYDVYSDSCDLLNSVNFA